MKTLSAVDWDDRNDLRLSQKPSALLIRKKFGLDAAEVEKKKWNKNVPTEYRHYLSKKSPFHQVLEVTSLCLRGTLQRREKKRMVRHEVRSTIKIHHYIRLVCESRAKIPSSDPKTSLTTRRLLFFEAIETIVWKLQIVLAFRIVSKYFESGTIIWKPGLK